LEANLGATYREKKEAIQVTNKEVNLEAILEATKGSIMEAIFEEKNDAIMETNLGVNLEAKLKATLEEK
jgi:hypothetical protein